MFWNVQPPAPLDYFATLVQSDRGFPLLEAAASIAQDEYPQMDLQRVLSRVDGMLARLRRRVRNDAPELERIDTLNRFFFEELGFGINQNDYYDPENSYLHHVLESRRGIPVSLAVVWLELAQGIGLEAFGISFPGHFMLKVLMPQGHVVLDPLTGRSFTSGELARQLQKQIPTLAMCDEHTMPLALFLQNASPREIIARMLRNLAEIFRYQKDAQRLLAVQQRLVALLPTEWAELRERAKTYIELGQSEQAALDLQTYLQHAGGAQDAAEMTRLLMHLRGQAGLQ